MERSRWEESEVTESQKPDAPSLEGAQTCLCYITVLLLRVTGYLFPRAGGPSYS